MSSFFMHIFFFLLITKQKTQKKTTTKHNDTLSLFPPACDENGRSSLFQYFDDNVIFTFAGDAPHVQLCYDTISKGGFISKNKITSNFRLDLSFELDGNGDGLALWLSNDTYQSGDFFGHNNMLNGICIVLDTRENNPKLGLVIGTSKKISTFDTSVLLKKSIFNKECNLRVMGVDGELKVYFGTSKLDNVFSVNNAMVSDVFYKVTSANSVSGICKVFSVKVSDVESVKVDVRRRSRLVWVVIFGGIGCLIYYLIRKQKDGIGKRM